MEKENRIGTVLVVLGQIIIALGIILAFVLGGVFPAGRYGDSYNFGLALLVFVSGAFSGLFFMGLGEIITLLHANAVNSQKILTIMQENKTVEAGSKITQVGTLEDIERNLPKI